MKFSLLFHCQITELANCELFITNLQAVALRLFDPAFFAESFFLFLPVRLVSVGPVFDLCWIGDFDFAFDLAAVVFVFVLIPKVLFEDFPLPAYHLHLTAMRFYSLQCFLPGLFVWFLSHHYYTALRTLQYFPLNFLQYHLTFRPLPYIFFDGKAHWQGYAAQFYFLDLFSTRLYKTFLQGR